MQHESSLQATPASLLDAALTAAGLKDTAGAPLLAAAADDFADDFAGDLAVHLFNKSYAELREVGAARAEHYVECARLHSQYVSTAGIEKLIASAGREYCAEIPGDTLESQLGRITDRSFWSRFYMLKAKRAHEFAYIRAGFVAKHRELYVSDSTLGRFRQSRKAQAEFLQNYCIVDSVANAKGEHTRRPLADVAKSAESKKAKLWAFLCGIEQLSQEAGLSCGLLTLTLEESFHPNPASGGSKYDGVSTPLDAARELSRRWNCVQRDLDNLGIAVSGARFVETHGDACPHWHLWIHYQEEHLLAILSVLSRYFTRGVRVKRVVEDAAGKLKSKKDGKRFREEYERFDAAAVELVPSSKRAVRAAGVELSVINRAFANGATYAAKYSMKSLDESPAAERVAAARWTWGFRGFQLFGVQKCMTLWDEMFRARELPTDPTARALFDAVHTAPGFHEKQIRNRATGEVETVTVEGGTAPFMRLLGGLAAARSSKQLKAQLSYTDAQNRYGDATKIMTGLTICTPDGEYLYSAQTREPGRFSLIHEKQCDSYIASLKPVRNPRIARIHFELAFQGPQRPA